MKLAALQFSVALIALLAVNAFAEDKPDANQLASDVSFIRLGQDYVIHFSDDKNPFRRSQLVVTANPKKADGSPAGVTVGPATINYVVSVFTVLERGGGSWVLVEHPASIEDSFKWNLKRMAMAALNDETMTELEVTPGGKEQLKELREQAAQDVPTAKTWVNLHHAIAIAEPPKRPLEFKLSVTAQTAK